MGEQWHYSRRGKEGGPVSAADLKRMASAGQLSPTDQVWKGGMANWARADTIKGLFDGAAAAPIPQVIPVDPSKIFSENLANAKKTRAEAVQRAMADGAGDAEIAFPDIVREIEGSAKKGWCQRQVRVKFERIAMMNNTIDCYLAGYKDRLAHLANNSGFSFEFRDKESEGTDVVVNMVIQW
jgi:hypothetical protein